MKCNKLILIITFCLLAITARSQNKLDDIVETNHNLETSIKDFESQINNCRTAITHLRHEIEKDCTTIKNLNRQIDALKNQSTKSVIETLTKEIDSLKLVDKFLRDSIINTRNNIARQEHLLSRQNNDLGNMAAYAQIQNRKQMKTNLLYLNQRYSRISLDSIKSLIANADKYISEVSYSDYKSRLEYALQNKLIFDEGYKSINSPFVEQHIISIRDKIINLLNNYDNNNSVNNQYKLTKEQFNELDTLDIKLSRYKNGVAALKTIINTINENDSVLKGREDKNKEFILPIVHKYCKPKVGTSEYKTCERYFFMIPYLRKMLYQYVKEIKKYPFKYPTEIEKKLTN